MENVLGVGGLDADGEYKRNVMQMLHGAYNIQNWHETEELRGIWNYVDTEHSFKRLEEPVLTR